MRVYNLESTKNYIGIKENPLDKIGSRTEERAMLEFEALLFSHILKSSGILGQKGGLKDVLEPILLPQLATEICKGCDLGIAKLINRGTEPKKVIKRSEKYYEISR